MFARADIYWLGMDENVWPNPAYPSKGRIREAMAITVAMGGNTIRCHTLGARYVRSPGGIRGWELMDRFLQHWDSTERMAEERADEQRCCECCVARSRSES